MARVVAASDEARLEHLDVVTHSPAVGRGARPDRLVPEGSLEEVADRRRDVPQPQRVGRRRDARPQALAPEGEEPLAQRRLHRDRPLRVPPGERVSAHEQQVEDQHREPEAVVVGRAHHVGELGPAAPAG